MHDLQGELSINVQAIGNNWVRLSSRLRQHRPAAECGAVVKAGAYGLGLGPVSKALDEAGCRTFFVANLVEALALREVLPLATIVVFVGVQAGELEVFAEANLTPVLTDPAQVARWAAFCESRGQVLPSMLKMDTGMTRMGITAAELDELLDFPERLRRAGIVAFLSHMACADEPDHPLNARQLTTFVSALKRVRAVLPQVRGSLANSSSLFLPPEFHFDLARPGAALYGVNPAPGQVNPVEPVVRLRLPILRKRPALAGDFIGYGATYQVGEQGAYLAVAMGGYADGLFRSLANKAQAICGGMRVPMVGRVSMDSCIFDISAVAAAGIEPDFIELLGPELGVDDLASAAGTIAYEVLTNLGLRYRREYVRGWG